LPNTETNEDRRTHRGEQDEYAKPGWIHRTSTSNAPVRISRAGLAWTQIR